LQNTQNGTPPTNIWARKVSADGIPPTGIPFDLQAGETVVLDTLWSDGGQNHIRVGSGFSRRLQILNCQLNYAQQDGILFESVQNIIEALILGNKISNSGIASPNTYSGINFQGDTSDWICIANDFSSDAATPTQAHAISVGGGINLYLIADNNVTTQAGTPIVTESVAATQEILNNLGFNPIGFVTPPASPLTSGTVYQNTSTTYITIYQPAYATASGTAGTVTVALGATDTPSTLYTKQIPGTTSSTAPDVCTVRVPPSWYYSFTASGATLTAATILGE
jgi:hypothetical protein